jgi:hypothetical protein
LDEWPYEVEQLAREYGCLPDNPADDLKPTEIIEELVAQMGGEADKDNIDQQVVIQRAQAYLKRASWIAMASGCSVPGHTGHALNCPECKDANPDT